MKAVSQVGRRRVVDTPRRIADAGEDRQPDDDEGGAHDVAADDLLLGEEVPQRHRPDDRRHEQRLDDGHPAAVERGGLEQDSEDLRDEAEEPDLVGQEPGERLRVARLDAHGHRGLLPQRRREREKHRRQDREQRR